MHVGTVALVAFLVVVSVAVLWKWWRAPRAGKYVTPITDGWWHSIQFRPGPAPLPEWDANPSTRDPAPARAA